MFIALQMFTQMTILYTAHFTISRLRYVIPLTVHSCLAGHVTLGPWTTYECRITSTPTQIHLRPITDLLEYRTGLSAIDKCFKMPENILPFKLNYIGTLSNPYILNKSFTLCLNVLRMSFDSRMLHSKIIFFGIKLTCQKLQIWHMVLWVQKLKLSSYMKELSQLTYSTK